ncbi:MAG: helix-turn-helix domain-containing protein [Clostridium sp.]|nr:helix-turn-helix domain-containing protein [Clostridium sp.]
MSRRGHRREDAGVYDRYGSRSAAQSKDRSNSAGSCWPGIKTIARDMNLSRSTVKRALADLEQHGYLAKLPRYRPNGSNTSNLYTLK